MSGPKVVRVVSREEKLERVNQQQDLMQNALESLRSFALKHHLLDQKLSEELNKREASYSALNEKDYYRVDAFSAQEVTFLVSHQQTLTEQLIEQQQQFKQRVQRLKSGASSLKKAYQQRQQSVPAILSDIEISSSKNNLEQLANHEQQLQSAYQALISPAKAQKLSAEQQALQSRLQTDQPISRYNKWLAEQIPSRSKQQIRLDYLISHLQLLETSSSQLQAFIERAKKLEQSSKQSSLNLKINSLILEVSEFIKATLANPPLQHSTLQTVLEQAEDYVQTQQRHYIAESRRQAVLGGLEELGYNINEKMSTAWVENGRLIVKKSSSDSYGVELSAPNEVQRIQARMTVTEQAPDSETQDKQVEGIWCNDFSQLQQQLAQKDSDIILDKALPAGSVRVKKIKAEEWSQEQERQERYGSDRGLLEQQLKGK